MLFRLFSIKLLLRELFVGYQLLSHSFSRIRISQQFITICDNLQIFRTLNSNIVRLFSLGKTFLDLKNIALNFFRLLGDFIARKLDDLRPLCNIRIFRITAGLIGKSFIKISLRISDLLLVLRTHHFNRSKSRMVRRSIYITASGRIRNIGSTGRTSDTSTAGRVTKNRVRGNTSETPTSRGVTRIIVTILTIPCFLLILELLLHIFKVVLLLKGHFLLLVLPIAASLNTTEEGICSTGSDITNSTGSGRPHQLAKTTETFTKI